VHVAVDQAGAEDIVRNEPVGVLVTDTGAASLPRFLGRLSRWNANLVVIAIGERASADALMRLTERGTLYRFLMQPPSAGQLRLSLEAALRAYLDRLRNAVEQARHTRVDAREARPSQSALPFSLAAAIFLGSLSGFFLLNQEEGNAPTATPATLTLDADGRALSRALVAAQRALEEQRFVEPPGDNAYYYYKQILAIAPHHADAARGINDLVNDMFLQAETALRESRYEDARDALSRARRITPSHPRLGVIATQVDTAEQRSLLDGALRAARAADFDRANALLARAASGRPGETTALRTARQQLRTIRDENDRQRADLLDAFDASLSDGRLTAPWTQNARAQFEALARLGEPETSLAPLRAELLSALDARIEESFAENTLNEAGVLLDSYRAVAADAEQIARADRLSVDLASRRAATLEVARLVDLATARLNDGRLVQPVEDNAGVYIDALFALSPRPPAATALGKRYAAALADQAVGLLRRARLDEARRYLNAAERLGLESQALNAARLAYREAADRAVGGAEQTRLSRSPEVAGGDTT
jgi:hypothetical protein